MYIFVYRVIGLDCKYAPAFNGRGLVFDKMG